MFNFNNTKIPKFRRFVLQNFPFIEQDFDALTDYQLICKVVEYLNKVIDQTNTTTTQVSILTDAFNQLKSFVEHYFDNLDVQEEINNKLDELVADGTLTELLANYAMTKVDYFAITTESTMDDIKKAFLGNGRAKIIEFEKGNYTLSEQVALTSHTKVILNGSSISSSYTDQWNDNIIFTALNENATGYNGISDFEIIDGFINTGFVFMHANNIKFNTIEFGNEITSHAIQIAGCENFTVENCTFNGTIISDAKGNTHECIQIETCNYTSQPYLPEESSTYDHTGCKNIKIVNCTFNNGDEINTRNYISIGHHAYDDSNRLAHKNLLIENCQFKTNHYSDIRLAEIKGAVIRNNTFNQVNDYNDQNSIRISWQNEDILIENNTWLSTKSAIASSNQQQRNNIAIRNNNINASISNSPSCIGCYNTTNLVITGNHLVTTGVAIYTQQGTGLSQENITINNNIFDMTASTSNGIRVFAGDKFTIMNNLCLQGDTTSAFCYCQSNNKVTYANNIIKNDTTYHVNNFNSINDYSNVYNTSLQVYNGSATYTEITDGTFSRDVTKFNSLMLILHDSGSTAGGVETVIIKPYELREKIDARKYNVIFSNGSNATKYGQLTITNGTTFNWSSPDSVTLRKVYAFNQVLQ